MPFWPGLGAIGDAGAGFLQGSVEAEQEKYRRGLEAEQLRGSAAERARLDRYAALNEEKERRALARSEEPEEVAPRGRPTMTADGRPVVWYREPKTGRVFPKIAEVPPGIRFATPPTKPTKIEEQKQEQAFRAQEGFGLGLRGKELRDYILTGRLDKAQGGVAKSSALDKWTADYERATGKKPSQALKLQKLGIKPRPIPAKIQEDVANWRSSEDFLDVMQGIVDKYQSLQAPIIGGAASFLESLRNPDVAEARTNFQIETSNAIQSMGAGARGYGPQERGFFEKLKGGFNKTPAQNRGIINAWRRLLRTRRSGAAKTFSALNSPEFAQAFGKDADLLKIAPDEGVAEQLPPGYEEAP